MNFETDRVIYFPVPLIVESASKGVWLNKLNRQLSFLSHQFPRRHQI